MKQLAQLLPFLAVLLLLGSIVTESSAFPSVYNTPNRGYGRDREREHGSSVRNESNIDKDKGYKIVIKLEDAFGKAAEDLELIKEMAIDIKLMKVLIEDMVPDVKQLRGNLPDESRERTENSSGGRALRQYAPRLSYTQNITANRLQDVWDAANPKSNCAEVRLTGEKKSGYFMIQPDRKSQPIRVYCDMENDGGGWTVFQRRGVLDIQKSIREDFYRDWDDYEKGFGNVQKDYWLGLEHIHALTKDCNNELLINLTNWEGASTYAKYSKFNISGRADFYRLAISGYSGNAGDALMHHNKMRFTTYDKQNDLNGEDNCARLYRGSWWYKDCFWSNLNGEYADDGSNGKMSTRQGMEWGSSGHFYSLMKTEMKIRPKC